MNRSYLVQLLVLFGIFSLQPAVQGAATLPFRDFEGLAYPGPGHFGTQWIIYGTSGPDVNPYIGETGGPISVLGLGYWTGPVAGNLTLTTIYGYDLDFGGSTLKMTGFDPSQPQVVVAGPEIVYGLSGTPYSSSSSYGAVPLYALPSLFPGFDLSAFEGDPSSVVYPFSTVVPRAAVPEPHSITILSVGLIAVASLTRGRALGKKPQPKQGG